MRNKIEFIIHAIDGIPTTERPGTHRAFLANNPDQPFSQEGSLDLVSSWIGDLIKAKLEDIIKLKEHATTNMTISIRRIS